MRYSREEQPLPAAASPTADSPGYVPESNPEEDDEDPEEDPADWERGRETSCLNHPTTITTYSTIISITTYTNLPYISWHRTTASPIRLRWALSGPADDRAERRGHHSNLHTISLPTFYHTLQYEIGESSAAACRLVDRLEVRVGQTMGLSRLLRMVTPMVGAIDEIAPTTVEGVNQRVTDLATIVEEETTSMYGIMEDAQDDRSLLRGRVNLLYRDRPVHRRLAVMIEREAKMAREAWGLSMDASDYARSDITGDRGSSDHKRQVQLTKTLRLLKGLQTQMVELRRQHGPAEGPSQPDAPGEAGSSS
ncbi:hypothetical protein Tco_1449383 [Tanacetum coccineum]